MSARSKRTPRRPELSQHFLRSGALARSITAQARISPQDVVVEIGPGRGALTVPLAGACGRLIAVELDPTLCDVLRRRFGEDPRVSVVQGDFLRFAPPPSPYKVVGNIPFGSTAAIVRHLADGSGGPTDAHLVVQREAAHRFAGAPHASESLMSLRIKPHWHVEIVRRLRRTDFDPPPRVDAVLLWLMRRNRSLVPPDERLEYRGFIESCFGRGGNTIGRCLASAFTRAEVRRLADDLRFRPEDPPSGLRFDQWLGLFRFHALRSTRSTFGRDKRHHPL